MNRHRFMELDDLVWKAYPELDPDGDGYGTAYAINQLFSKIVKEKTLRIDYSDFVTYLKNVINRFNTEFINIDSFISAVKIISPPQRFFNIAIIHACGMATKYELKYEFTETTIRVKWINELISGCYNDQTSKLMWIWEDILILPSENSFEEDLEKLINCLCSSRKNFIFFLEHLSIHEMEVYKAFSKNFDIWSIFDDDYFKHVQDSLWGEDVRSYQQIHLLNTMTQRCKVKMEETLEYFFYHTDAVENFIVFLMNCREIPAFNKINMMQIYLAQKHIKLTLPNPKMIGNQAIVWRIKKLKPCVLNVEKLFPDRPSCQKLYMDWYIKNIMCFSRDVYKILESTFRPYFILGEYFITSNDESFNNDFDYGFEHILHLTCDLNGERMVYSPFFELEYVDTLSDFSIVGCYITGFGCSSHKRVVIKGLEGYALPVDELAHQLIDIQLEKDVDSYVKHHRMVQKIDSWYVIEKNRPLKDLMLTHDTISLPTFISSQLKDLLRDPSLYKKYYNRYGYLYPTLWTYLDCQSAYIFTFDRLQALVDHDDNIQGI